MFLWFSSADSNQITPRLAINEQYAEEAQRLGLHAATPSSIKAAFRKSMITIPFT